MQGKCQMYSYAGDNTIVFFSHSDINILKEHLTQSTEAAIQWFNPPKHPIDGLNQITCKPIHQNFKRSLWKLVIETSLL